MTGTFELLAWSRTRATAGTIDDDAFKAVEKDGGDVEHVTAAARQLRGGG